MTRRAASSGLFLKLGSVWLLAISLTLTSAMAQTPGQERAKGAAAAALVAAPTIFRAGCDATSKNDGDRLFCIARTMAAEKGAQFLYNSKLREIAAGRDRMITTFLKTKQFAEKIYDDCMLRHGDEIEASGSFSQMDEICKLEKEDIYAGMERFSKVFNDGLK